ncbi:MAG: glycosyltransferase [Burkholderiales bacterium]|nr:glycosyltransferase [Bacteroidia bacterium]
MRVLLLSDTYSEHTEKWALGLASNGIEVGLFSFNKASYPWYLNKKNISLLFEPKEKLDISGKLSYLRFVGSLKIAIAQFKPDILHAHYATSYGLIGALSRFHPYVISAWGTDVMKFPQKNFINKTILKYNLRKADAICATSNTIKDFLKPVTDKPIHVIPFGVDVNEFSKKEVKSLFDQNTFVIGSIKPLEKLYNTDVLIKAFASLKKKHSDKSLKLVIIGEGSQMEELKKLSSKLNVQSDVTFTGRIKFSEVSNYFNMLDVLANISDYESFGVSVIEAMACEKPVVATNTGGLKEIIENSNFGSLVEVGSVEQTASEIEKYLLDETLKQKIGKAARVKVVQKYNWEDNILQMVNVYNQLLKK